jgi:endonuclease YncB( thermonuclease family)
MIKNIYLKSLPPIIVIIISIIWFFDDNKGKLLKNILNINNNYNHEVRAVFKAIDGDSLRMSNGQEIRLLKIDAPEYKQKCFDKDNREYHCGKVSSKFLRKLVKNRELNCKYQKKDIYDRYLAICYDGDKNINHEMVKNGMAIIYNIHDAGDELKLLEKTARVNKIGLWQGKFLTPREFRRMR